MHKGNRGQTKDISDVLVVLAYLESRDQPERQQGGLVISSDQGGGNFKWPTQILMERTGLCEKVCFRAMERAERRGLIGVGVSLRAGWVTREGHDLITNEIKRRGLENHPDGQAALAAGQEERHAAG